MVKLVNASFIFFLQEGPLGCSPHQQIPQLSRLQLGVLQFNSALTPIPGSKCRTWVRGSGPRDAPASDALTTPRRLAVHSVSFSVHPGLFLYCAGNRKPLFSFRNVLPILLGPDLVHSCLGVSKTMFSFLKKLIRPFAARETEGTRSPPRSRQEPCPRRVKQCFLGLVMALPSWGAGPLVSWAWKRGVYREKGQGW